MGEKLLLVIFLVSCVSLRCDVYNSDSRGAWALYVTGRFKEVTVRNITIRYSAEIITVDLPLPPGVNERSSQVGRFLLSEPPSTHIHAFILRIHGNHLIPSLCQQTAIPSNKHKHKRSNVDEIHLEKGKVSQLASKERAAHSFHFSLLIPFLTPCHPIQAQPAIPLKSINPDVRTTVMYNPASQPTGGSQSTYKMKNERLDGKILRETTQSE